MRKRIHTTVTLGAAAVLLGTTLVGCSSAGSGEGGEPLTIVTWGGTTEQAFQSALAAPFTEDTGIPVELVNPVDYGKYTAQMETDQVTWDFVDSESWYIMQNQDRWAPIDTDVVNYEEEDVIELPGRETPDADWLLPKSSYSFVIAHRTDTDAAIPSNWEEFFDTENFPGKRGIYNWPFGMLEVALIADGVEYEDLYPLDIDRALAKLDTVKDDLVFWNSGAELQQMITSGEVNFAFAWNNRITPLAKSGEPVAIEWGENLQDGGYTVTAKNNPQLDETMQLFDQFMEPETQTEIAEASGYSPATRSAFEALPEEDQPWYNAYPENEDQAIGSINPEWWAENFDEAVEKWESWAGQ